VENIVNRKMVIFSNISNFSSFWVNKNAQKGKDIPRKEPEKGKRGQNRGRKSVKK
jgi:hypothetical protein